MGLAELRGGFVALTPDGEAALAGDRRALREAVLRSPALREAIGRLRAARILGTGDPEVSCAAAWLVAAGLAAWDPDAGLVWDPAPRDRTTISEVGWMRRLKNSEIYLPLDARVDPTHFR
jgi:hypothetical protein